MSPPRILITLDTGESTRRGVRFPIVQQKEAYASAVVRAGGLPLWVGPESLPRLEALVELADGILVTGGDFDIPPEAYGGSAAGQRLDRTKPERSRFEAELTRAALARGLPILGVCGGMQLLAVVLGGRLHVDIAGEVPNAIEHEQPHTPAEPDHPVRLHGWMAQFGSETEVNSTHHQAVSSLPAALELWATAPDGVIEAAGDANRGLFAVQWHPELLDSPVTEGLYGAFVTSASDRR